MLGATITLIIGLIALAVLGYMYISNYIYSERLEERLSELGSRYTPMDIAENHFNEAVTSEGVDIAIYEGEIARKRFDVDFLRERGRRLL